MAEHVESAFGLALIVVGDVYFEWLLKLFHAFNPAQILFPKAFRLCFYLSHSQKCTGTAMTRILYSVTSVSWQVATARSLLKHFSEPAEKQAIWSRMLHGVLQSYLILAPTHKSGTISVKLPYKVSLNCSEIWSFQTNVVLSRSGTSLHQNGAFVLISRIPTPHSAETLVFENARASNGVA